MKHLKMMILIVACVFCAATMIYAHSSFTTDDEAYRVGYSEGFHHGAYDNNAGFRFDYRSGFRQGASYDTFNDEHFRDGYKSGYSDGYNSQASRYNDRDYDNRFQSEYSDRYSDGDSRRMDNNTTYRRTYSPEENAAVRVFTKKGFGGEMREFPLGVYRHLSGNFNDSIDSIQISGPVRVILFDKSDFQGQRLILEQSLFNLDELNFGSRAASMIIEPLR